MAVSRPPAGGAEQGVEFVGVGAGGVEPGVGLRGADRERHAVVDAVGGVTTAQAHQIAAAAAGGCGRHGGVRFVRLRRAE
ncbi:hypothetical protein GCM10009663_77860 [Kitasatospora arboriphila]|uniref:Uncharacterized protein n=1 Tax=Kitasatospora arboriphila TaxID=258052 RepID=A0ABN1U8T3_9ACTN